MLFFPFYSFFFCSCSVEYKLQTSCLTAHLSSCLAGVYAGFLPEVASLIRLLFYHCGDLKVDPAGMNQLLLNQIQCKSQVFHENRAMLGCVSA